MSIEEQIIENQNANGGGLASNITGKCQSNRHALASLDASKCTVGEFAQRMRKKHKIKISAKDVKAIYQHLFSAAPEWHHAGFKPKSVGGGMAVTYFIKSEEFEAMELGVIGREKIIANPVKTIGFYFTWDSDYSGNYGKKRNFKVLSVYAGTEFDKPRNFTPCNESEFEFAKLLAGKKYLGWDEPKLADFSPANFAAYQKELAEIAKRKAEFEAEQIALALVQEQQKAVAFDVLNDLRATFESAGVDFSQKNSAWHIYSKFFEGTPNQIKVSCGLIKSWISKIK